MANKSKAEITRHPLATAWDDWLTTDEGKSCNDLDTLTPRSHAYLENRLHRAFDAGAKTTQSSLAKDVLAEIVKVRDTAAPCAHTLKARNGVAVKDDIQTRLRDLFTKLGIKADGIGEG